VKLKHLARALQARVPGLAYQSALRMVTTREAPTIALAVALAEVLQETVGGKGGRGSTVGSAAKERP